MGKPLATQLDGNTLFSLFKEFEKYSLSYVYKGIFNPDHTDKILSLAETNMAITGESSKTQKRVYFVMVESLQNITRHQDVEQEEENHAFFVVHNRVGEYDLTSGNVVERAQIDDLKSKIDKINSLGPDELKDYYKYVLENTGMSDKGGAGLGLIEMARRSGNKLQYDFQELNDKQSYFYFKSRITSESAADTRNNTAINEAKRLHGFTRENHIDMIYQGVFTQDNLKSLLSMTEGSVAGSDNVVFKRRAANVMVELLQNICNHAACPDNCEEGKPGMIVVSTSNGGFSITSANYIGNQTKDQVCSRIEKVNAASDTELEDLYSDVILKEQEAGQKGAGLGFIDMKMKSGNKILSSVIPHNDLFSFISISVFIPFE
ncbi:MAG: SiaB family protein kinase [Bacteroidia bacterium]